MKAQNVVYLYVVLRSPKRLQLRELKCLHENGVEIYLLRPFTLTPYLKHIHFFLLSPIVLTLVQDAIRSADWSSNQDFSPGLFIVRFFPTTLLSSNHFPIHPNSWIGRCGQIQRTTWWQEDCILLSIVGRPQTLGSDCYLNSESVIHISDK